MENVHEVGTGMLGEYRADSLKTLASELPKYKLDLVKCRMSYRTLVSVNQQMITLFLWKWEC